MPTDPRSPLAAAVEALLKDVRHTGKVYPDGWTIWREVPADKVDALRTALAADAARRARAEAAVKHSDAEIAYRAAPPGRDLDEGLAVNAAFDEYVAARRRYEEATSNPRGREVVDG